MRAVMNRCLGILVSILFVRIGWIHAAASSVANDSVQSPGHRKLVQHEGVVKDQYLIQFRQSSSDDDEDDASFASSFAFNTKILQGLCRAFGAKILYEQQHFGMVTIQGVTSRLLLRILAQDSILVVEEDHYYQEQSIQDNAPWHLDRVDQFDMPLNHRYQYNYTGQGVTVYLLDSGIADSRHEDFGTTQMRCGWDAFDSGCADGTGHGTHLAGVVGGATFGVAKEANLVSVRVLDDQGTGRASDLLAGLEYVEQNKKNDPLQRNIITLALGEVKQGFVKGLLVRTALNRAVNRGTLVVTAAGNDGRFVCDGGSPLSVVTVGATTPDNRRAAFSNYGNCLDIFAPGVNVTSLSTPTLSRQVMSGTSVAAAMVAGVAALYLEQYPDATPRQIRNLLREQAAGDRLSDIGLGSPNLLLNTAEQLGRSEMPSMAPSDSPSPTQLPSRFPTAAPTYTDKPSNIASDSPSMVPTRVASDVPSLLPSVSSFPTSQPTQLNCGYPTIQDSDQVCFASSTELRRAVDDFFANNASATSDVARTYGWPIGTWCVDCVTDLSYLFSANRNRLFANTMNYNINDWNVSRATTLRGTFSFADKFDQPLDKWDVSRVVDMQYTFGWNSAFNQSLATWDTSRVHSMRGMFFNAWSFNQPLSSWNTSSVTDMSVQFHHAQDFNQPLGSWDVSAVTDMTAMFAAARSFNQPLPSWDVRKVKSTQAMFFYARGFNQDLSTWNVTSLEDLSVMFWHTGVNANLCSWGRQIPKGAVYDRAFLLTKCSSSSDPVPDANPPGPFCGVCE